MADLYLNNPGIQADQDSMVQATTTMYNAVEAFVGIVKANMPSFTGVSADTLGPILNKLTTEADNMNQQFGAGTQTLGNMVDILNNGDRQGGQILSGS